MLKVDVFELFLFFKDKNALPTLGLENDALGVVKVLVVNVCSLPST